MYNGTFWYARENRFDSQDDLYNRTTFLEFIYFLRHPSGLREGIIDSQWLRTLLRTDADRLAVTANSDDASKGHSTTSHHKNLEIIHGPKCQGSFFTSSDFVLVVFGIPTNWTDKELKQKLAQYRLWHHLVTHIWVLPEDVSGRSHLKSWILREVDRHGTPPRHHLPGSILLLEWNLVGAWSQAADAMFLVLSDRNVFPGRNSEVWIDYINLEKLREAERIPNTSGGNMIETEDKVNRSAGSDICNSIIRWSPRSAMVITLPDHHGILDVEGVITYHCSWQLRASMLLVQSPSHAPSQKVFT